MEGELKVVEADLEETLDMEVGESTGSVGDTANEISKDEHYGLKASLEGGQGGILLNRVGGLVVVLH